jgi:hypothetical protein
VVLPGDRRLAGDVPARCGRRLAVLARLARQDRRVSRRQQDLSAARAAAETRSQIKTPQGKAALRSLFELRELSGKAVELYFGPKAPRGQEARWIRTLPGKGWFVYFRIYGPEKPAFDGRWKPGDFERVTA